MQKLNRYLNCFLQNLYNMMEFIKNYDIIYIYNDKQEEYFMSEERDDLVILVDENGEESEFEHLDTIDFNGSEYVVLLPVEKEENEDDMEEVVILKIVQDPDGEDSFVTIEDENELESVFEEFKARMEEEFDFYEE